MSDYAVCSILVFSEEFFCTGKSDLVDVFLYVVLIHTDAPVADGERTCFFIYTHSYVKLSEFTFEISESCQCLDLLRGVYRIAHKFTQEDFMIAI